MDTTDFKEFLTLANIFTLLGGLGLFLFGIKSMGEGLKALAGENLRDIINKYTSNRFTAALTGAVTTVAIQSSSGTTALTISLVRAGLMNLRQAIGIIMGANVGTTVTSLIYVLNVKALALPIVFVGAAIYMFSNNRRTVLMAQTILGFGLLFYGLTVMEGPLDALAETESFTNLMQTVSTTPVLGILIGVLLTVIVQSSSATIVILQGLYAMDSFGFDIAFAVLLGDNIGTTITSLLASIGGSRDSVRAAISHVIFNLFGTIAYFILLFPLGLIDNYENFLNMLTDNKKLQIFYAHFFFNLSVTFTLIWFIDYLEKLVKFLIPQTKGELEINFQDHYLDKVLIHESPSFALAQGQNAVVDMSDLVEQQLDRAVSYLTTKSKIEFNYIDQLELAINALDKKLKTYFRDLSAEEMSEEDSKKTNYYMYAINDLERIADLTINVTHKLAKFTENHETLSVIAQEEVTKMLVLAHSATRLVKEFLATDNEAIAEQIFQQEKKLDKLERKYYKEHLKRVKSEECRGRLSISYVDLISDIERIGDHAENIAEYYMQTDEILTTDEEEINISEFITEENKTVESN